MQIKAEHGILKKYYIDSMDFDGVKKRSAATIDSIARQAIIGNWHYLHTAGKRNRVLW